MGTEYYIIKPNKKQIFYLGKYITHLDGIPNRIYNKEPAYPLWEGYHDVVQDISENCNSFLCYENLLISQVWEFCQAIYDFCDGPVYLDSDVNDQIEWSNWDEIDVFEQILCSQDWSSLLDYIPQKYWIKNNEEINTFQTIKQYLEKLNS